MRTLRSDRRLRFRVAVGSIAALGVVALLLILLSLRGGVPATGLQPHRSPGASATIVPEPSFTPSPVPEASIVGALPPPAGIPEAAAIVLPVAPAPTRAPATPTPTPDPNVWRVEGVILEDDTKLPIREVCVVIGPHGCQRGSVRTDSRGVFYIDVPKNPAVIYDLYFVRDGYWTVWMRIKPEGPSVYNLALTKR